MAHALHLYQEEACLLDAIADFIAEGLRLEEAVLFIGSQPRWDLVLERLETSGVNARARAMRGQLRLIGAHLVLSTCMANGAPVRHRLGQLLGAAFGLARMRYARVRVVSELADTLWREGETQAACALERAWRPLLAVHDVELLCPCSIDSLEGHVYDGTLQGLAAAHTHLHPARDEAGFEQAVSDAVAEVLEGPLVDMLQTVSALQRSNAQMPPGQAILFWLKENMPRTAEKVLRRARARWNEH
jgi:DcmR-like sensory protein